MRIPAARSPPLSGVRQVDPGVTVAAYARFWIDAIAPTWDESGRRTGIKHSSRRGYEKHARLSIARTELGRARVDRVTARMGRTWRDRLQTPERGLGPRSADHARKESELISINPARDVSAPPQRTDFEARIFTLAEARRFLEIIRGHVCREVILPALPRGAVGPQALGQEAAHLFRRLARSYPLGSLLAARGRAARRP